MGIGHDGRQGDFGDEFAFGSSVWFVVEADGQCDGFGQAPLPCQEEACLGVGYAKQGLLILGVVGVDLGEWKVGGHCGCECQAPDVVEQSGGIGVGHEVAAFFFCDGHGGGGAEHGTQPERVVVEIALWVEFGCGFEGKEGACGALCAEEDDGQVDVADSSGHSVCGGIGQAQQPEGDGGVGTGESGQVAHGFIGGGGHGAHVGDRAGLRGHYIHIFEVGE